MLKTSAIKILLAITCIGFLNIISPASQAHEFLESDFRIIHPWTSMAKKGDSGVPLRMRITDITRQDRLVAASSPLAGSIELVKGKDMQKVGKGLEVEPGKELILDQEAEHFVLNDVKTRLFWGRQYPLTLIFEKAGAIEVDFVAGLD